MNKNILVKTPLRISLLGGGTDIYSFYKENIGRVISFTINKYIYIFIKELNEFFEENYRLNYYITERVNSIPEIKNEITRESILLHRIKKKLYISTIADIPQSSGLGSSSSFAVGLNLAFRRIKGEQDSKKLSELAVSDAINVEISKLKKPIGLQDQVASGFGGLNYIEFSKKFQNHYKVQPINSNKIKKMLSENLLLVWTGKQRNADNILIDQLKNHENNIENLKKLSDLTNKFYLNEINNFNLKILAEYMNESWEIKKNFSKLITNHDFDKIYNLALKNGALGGKLLGAGGGGFFLFIVENSNKLYFKKKMSEYIIEDFDIDNGGANVVNLDF